VTGRARLLLVGAGHSHVEILRRQILARREDLSLTVVSAGRLHHYSGMVPGFLRGSYREDEIAFDIPRLTARAGGRFVEGRAVAVEPKRRVVRLEDGREEGYDLASFGVGSSTRGAREEGVRRYARTVKPIRKAIDLRNDLERLAAEGGDGTARAAVVGAGAAGVEVACALAGVLDAAGRRREITILDGASEILSGYSRRFRRRAREVLEGKGIGLELGARVSSVSEGSVRTGEGREIPSDLTVWLTGPESYGIFEGSGLATDERGFLLVDDSLRSVSDPRIFGVGDCATLRSHPGTPKAGVYAVREGPVLWESLAAAIEGRDGPRYEPQAGFLSILNTGDGKALLRYRGIVSWSRWAWKLKDRIDRRFMRKYKRYEGAPPA
jgi:pyridine nucleotide-disulfide oxidoreductase family protein